MGFVKKYRFEILLAVLICVLFFFLRISNLTYLPIFTDEAIYIRWAQIALQDPNWRFISLSDGKQPLFVWGAMSLLPFFKDPLMAGRMVSVISGIFSVIGIWFVTYALFKRKKTAYFASLIYVCYPFAAVYDRMALYDSLSGAFTIWSLYFAILLVRYVRLDIALTLGITIGLGALNKSTNLFSLYLLPVTFLLFDFSKKNLSSRISKWVVLIFLTVILSQLIYSILRLSGLYHMIELKNALFIYPFGEWINHPFDSFFGNLTGLSHWLFEYLKLPLLILIIASFFKRKFIREKIMLLLFMLLPYVALALFARILFPRFIFFMTLSLIPLMAVGLNNLIELSLSFIKKQNLRFSPKILNILMISIFLFYPLFVSFQFTFDPINSRISKPDNAQYVNHWTAGWGVKESVDIIKKDAESTKVFVATEGTFGLLPFALEMYLDRNPNVEIRGYWPINDRLPQEVLDKAQKGKTYFIFYQPDNINPPNPENLRLISKVQAGNSIYFYRIYEVTSFGNQK